MSTSISSAQQTKVGYVIPEYPGQTHTWIWREVCHLREWGLPVEIFATRPPGERERARHAFATDPAARATYLWPMRPAEILATLFGAAVRWPVGLARCVRLGLTLPVEARPRWKAVLPLVLPACKLAREARRRGVTRLHTHMPASSAILCMMVRRLTGMPYTVSLVAEFSAWGGAMHEKLREAEFLFPITEWLIDELRRDYPEIERSRYRLSRLGVDPREWSPAAPRAADGASARPFTLVSVSRLYACKGHDVLLRAVGELRAAGRDVRLRVAGDGPERGALERLAAELGVADAVTFLGSVSEQQCREEMRGADAFVLASNAEPLGVVYIEAMAVGAAVVGTAAGGVPEIITDGVDGLLVPPRDPGALAAAIARLMDDPDFRGRLGGAARRTVRERFDSRLGAAVIFDQISGRRVPRPALGEVVPLVGAAE